MDLLVGSTLPFEQYELVKFNLMESQLVFVFQSSKLCHRNNMGHLHFLHLKPLDVSGCCIQNIVPYYLINHYSLALEFNKQQMF